MKYYKTIKYRYNIWKSDGTSWWFWDDKKWIKWPMGGGPTYDRNDLDNYTNANFPREISESEVFLELL